MLNLQLAKAYLAGTDAEMPKRTWQHALQVLTETKRGANKERWRRVATDRALSLLWVKVIVETEAELILKVLRIGTISTNVYLRRLYNFCVDMNWLPWPIVPKRQWPIVRFQEKRAVTWEEHCRTIEREKNPERKAYYQLAWYLGASQSDLAHLQAEDVDWPNRVISFFRRKTRWRSQQPPQIRFGRKVEAILATHPQGGTVVPCSCKSSPWRPRHGGQTALCGSGHSRCVLTLVSLRMGRTGEDSWLPGTLCTACLGP
jgi:integrase